MTLSLDATFCDWAGYAGVGVYLAAYIALQLGAIRGSSYRYVLLNMIAAILVLLSLYSNLNLASAIIQGCWVVISLVGITRVFLMYHHLRFNDEEAFLVKQGLNAMPKAMSRRLLNAGVYRARASRMADVLETSPELAATLQRTVAVTPAERLDRTNQFLGDQT